MQQWCLDGHAGPCSHLDVIHLGRPREALTPSPAPLSLCSLLTTVGDISKLLAWKYIVLNLATCKLRCHGYQGALGKDEHKGWARTQSGPSPPAWPGAGDSLTDPLVPGESHAAQPSSRSPAGTSVWHDWILTGHCVLRHSALQTSPGHTEDVTDTRQCHRACRWQYDPEPCSQTAQPCKSRRL